MLALCGPVWSASSAPPPQARTVVDPHDPPRAEIKPRLARQLASRDSVDFWVRFADRAPLAAAQRAPGWNQRGAAVASELRRTARESQAGVRALLRGADVEHQAFWITNAIKVTGGGRGARRPAGVAPRGRVAVALVPGDRAGAAAGRGGADRG
ncbi:hypothetical protein [Nocardioides sp. TF02-7]|uniref:hypothetical protein n=1 Tax=Nocardioides sp. TF02-7 TaxID=2917724 RepID=UPI001F067569|nr:hypothetical protein [Nocardioides sp. TF02-7]UMG92874.1 hypothetical protein MF408_00315 [Nocardioides sp. TF02-7]